MDVHRIASGLWRWTAYHEEWRKDVGCVYLEADDATVLFDPLVPPEDSERFLEYLDADVERARADVHILLTVYWHVRSATELAKRYDAAVWAPARSALPGRAEDEAVAERRPARRPAARRARSIRVRPRGGARLPPAGSSARSLSGTCCSEIPFGSAHQVGSARAASRPFARRSDRCSTSLSTACSSSHGDPVLRAGHNALAAALG